MRHRLSSGTMVSMERHNVPTNHRFLLAIAGVEDRPAAIVGW
jgi:hypothetical protein